MIKRITALFLSAVFMILLCSCDTSSSDDSFHIVCTAFPQYDWTRNLLEGSEGIKITLLLDSATDMHSYQASARDITLITDADIFIYNGGDSDLWVEDVLNNSENKSRITLNLMKSLGEDKLICTEETAEDHHSHEHSGGEYHEHDEHIWLSPEKAILLCRIIASALTSELQEYEDTINTNLSAYESKLRDIDRLYEKTVKDGSKDTLLVADRFPFRYLTSDYSLNYCAAFTGCSAESEASAETLVTLIETARTLKLNAVIITETSDGDIAQTIKEHIKDRDIQILVLNSIQSVSEDITTASYIGYMEKNAEILQKALS